MHAYYYLEDDSPPCAAHKGPDVPLSALADVGVLYRHGDMDMVNALAVERKYINRDTVDISAATPNIDALSTKFFTEHLHDDEEIRYIVDGEAYFDVRSNQDKWIRVLVGPQDLLVLPPQVYHRFTLTESQHVNALRLFQNAPNWIAHNR